MLSNNGCASDTNCVQPEPDGVIQEEPDSSNQQTTKKIPVCWFYSRYKACRFRENCNFRHSTPKYQKRRDDRSSNDEVKVPDADGDVEVLPKKSTADQHDDDELQIPDERRGVDAEEVASSDVNVSEESNDAKPPKKVKRPCLFFFRFKYCRYGDKCYFSHVGTNRHWEKRKGGVKGSEEADKENAGEALRMEKGENEQGPNQIQKPVPTKDIKLDDLTEEMIQKLR